MNYVKKQYLYKLWQSLQKLSDLPQIDKWLSLSLKEYKQFGKKDRAWYSDMIFKGIRHAYLIVFYHWNKKTEITIEAINQFEAQVNSAEIFFKQLKAIPAEDFFIYLERLEEIDLKDIEDFTAIMLKNSIPLWFQAALKKRMTDFPENIQKYFITQQNQRPPLWIRIKNHELVEVVQQELQENNFSIIILEDLALALTGDKSIFTLAGYKKGYFEIQDYASQQIGLALAVKNRDLIWDACAGGGGKTMQLAAFLNNKGVVYASDIRSYKFDEIKRRAKKAQFFNIRCIEWDGETLPSFSKEVLNNKGFDWVLVDAPCSSSGTWRRNPDAKYRFDFKEIEKLNQLQLQILTNASLMVKSQGSIVYATCSWLVEENEAIVAAFLEKQDDFSLISQKLLGHPAYDSDTTFVAVLEKK